MKKALLILITAAVFAAAAAGCGSEKPNSKSQTSFYSSSRLSKQISDSSTKASQNEETTVPEILPKGVKRSDKNTLQYTTSGNNVFTVYFPSEFSSQNNDLTPTNGIYLQNDEGTATLLIEFVDYDAVSNDELADYLKEKYPDSEVSLTDSGVIFTDTATDNGGNEFTLFRKISMADNGYITAALCCGSDIEDKYKGALEKITFQSINDGSAIESDES